MLYAALLLFIAGLTFGGAGMNWWRETLHKAEESRRIAAEAKLAEETAKAIKEGENKLIDMAAAFDAGQQQAKVIERKIYVKGQDYVRTVPAYSNPVCRVDAAGVQQLNDQIARMHAAAAAAVLGIGLPAAGPDQERRPDDGRPVPAVSGKPPAAEGVPGTVREPEAAGSGTGQGVPRDQRPKPTPVK
jgi:hypothetical protein